jgi:predicted Fe-Mo cluster-binding NifX family protein
MLIVFMMREFIFLPAMGSQIYEFISGKMLMNGVPHDKLPALSEAVQGVLNQPVEAVLGTMISILAFLIFISIGVGVLIAVRKTLQYILEKFLDKLLANLFIMGH